MVRGKPNVLIVGTPGVGKSTLSKEVANRSTMIHIELSKVITEKKLYEEWDDEMNCSVFDDDMVYEHLEKELQEGNKIVDFHSCSFMEDLCFDAVYAIRTDNGVLYDRLEKREYPQKKITENIECEIFGIVYEEATDVFGVDAVKELENNTNTQLEENIQLIVKNIKELHKEKKRKSSKK